jgi:hypothetical protein
VIAGSAYLLYSIYIVNVMYFEFNICGEEFFCERGRTETRIEGRKN